MNDEVKVDVKVEKKSWSDAFKDPKVLVVIITTLATGFGASAKLFMEIGELRSDVQHYQNDVKRMDGLIQKLTEQCGGGQ